MSMRRTPPAVDRGIARGDRGDEPPARRHSRAARDARACQSASTANSSTHGAQGSSRKPVNSPPHCSAGRQVIRGLLFISSGSGMSTLDIERLEGPAPSVFDCGRTEQNRHLHDQAWQNQQQRLSTTSLILADGVPAAFVTVCMDALPLSRRERGASIAYRSVSALKLAQLGVDQRFQGKGLGRWAVSAVIQFAYEISELVGCRYVTLDAQPELETWYTACETRSTRNSA